MKKKLPSLVVLGIICLAAGLLLSLTNQLTAERIDLQEAISKEAARAGVLEAADHFEALETQEGRYKLDNSYAGVDENGKTVGYVGQTTVTGFGGPIEVVAGLDTDGVITGIAVGGADFSETAGLGALTKEAAFTDQFKGQTPAIALNENGVDSVTGASTSSRAVISGVNTVANYFYTYELGLMEEEAVVYTGQTVSATERGFGGGVTATIGFAEDDTIEYLAIDTPDETDGLGRLASESAFTSQFIGKAGPFAYGEDGIEAVTGATFTSTAAINAINTIVSGGGAESAEPVSATVQGFGGEVTVTARLNGDNSIAALSIDTPNETDGLGKLASESAFTSQFIGKTAPFAYGENGIDAVTGATVTSTAVIDALNSIVPAADGQTAPVVAVPEETAVPDEPEAAEAEPEPADVGEAPAIEAEEPAETNAEPETEAPASEEPEAEAPAEAEAAVEETAAEKASAAYADGAYSIEKTNDFSTIDVELTISGGAISDCVIVSSGATDLMTDEMDAAWAAAIVENQGADADVISSASITFSAATVTDAINELLAQAAAD